jgi:hypothetical protein
VRSGSAALSQRSSQGPVQTKKMPALFLATSGQHEETSTAHYPTVILVEKRVAFLLSLHFQKLLFCPEIIGESQIGSMDGKEERCLPP